MKNRKPSLAAHCLVLAGPLLALLYTLIALTGGRGVRFISGAWRRDYEAGGPFDDEDPFGHGPVA